MKSRGLLYGGKLQYWHKKLLPVIEVGTTQETEHPYRLGKCLIFRVPFTLPGFYVGIWHKNPKVLVDDDEEIDKILAQALKGRSAWTPDDGLFDEFFKD
jgi:hypothetical protein